MSAKTSRRMDDNSHEHQEPQDSENPPDDGGRDLKGAVEEAREIVDFTAQKVRDARELVASIHSPFLNGLLGFYALTAVIGTSIVAVNGFRDWYMFLGMYTVIFVFLSLRRSYRPTGSMHGSMRMF